jgi:hypothetical protein
MADFNTILNPTNTTLDLYCHSINTAGSLVYGSFVNQINVTINDANPSLPIPLTSVNINKMRLIENLLITADIAGYYSIVTSCNGANTTIDNVSPAPSLSLNYKIYDSGDNLLLTSEIIQSYFPYTIDVPATRQTTGMLSNNGIFYIPKNGYCTLVLNTVASSAPYNVTFFNAVSSINKLN